MDDFNKLPAMQQRQAADGFRQFGEKLSAFLGQAAQQGQMDDGVVTVDHVRAFMRQM
jgi:hypothetical protein